MNAALLLKAKIPKNISPKGHASTHYAIYSFLAAGFGLLILMFLILHFSVFGPIKDFTSHVIFPITRDELTAEKQRSLFEDYLGSGERILVVDDEKMKREIACEMLAKMGCSTDAVSSGEEAIEYLKEHSVELIVLDMITP